MAISHNIFLMLKKNIYCPSHEVNHQLPNVRHFFFMSHQLAIFLLPPIISSKLILRKKIKYEKQKMNEKLKSNGLEYILKIQNSFP